MGIDKLNEIIKNCEIPGLNMKQVFEIQGSLYLLSTVDIYHGNDHMNDTEWVHRYETILFKDCIIDDSGIVDLGHEIFSCSYRTEKKAIEEHNKKVWWLEAYPDEVIKVIQQGVE